MTPNQIELVQRSFERVVLIKDFVARLFYARLFERHPDLRLLFPIDMTVQGARMMIALATIMSELDHPERVAPYIRSLAISHQEYGTRPEDYEAIGEALIWALSETLERDFTAEIRAAWTVAYQNLSQLMIAAVGRHTDAA
jgi:nitric oxide dioxygenase